MFIDTTCHCPLCTEFKSCKVYRQTRRKYLAILITGTLNLLILGTENCKILMLAHITMSIEQYGWASCVRNIICLFTSAKCNERNLLFRSLYIVSHKFIEVNLMYIFSLPENDSIPSALI